MQTASGVEPVAWRCDAYVAITRAVGVPPFAGPSAPRSSDPPSVAAVRNRPIQRSAVVGA